METYRLKNIAIVILLLLNGFLLVLLGYQYWRSRQAAADAAEQLTDLYASRQVELGEGVDLSRSPLSPLTLSRRDETEAAIAAELLGEEAAAASQGGGIVSYTGAAGVIRFRAGGSFDGEGLARPVEDPEAFVRSFCRQYGYGDVRGSVGSGTGTVTAIQRLDGVPVYGCELTLRFAGGVLTSVAGAHVSLENALTEGAEQMNCVTALVRFLDYREAAGVVCSAVTDAACVYRLQGGAVSLRLVPAWRIETDTYTCFLDCGTGEITRE